MLKKMIGLCLVLAFLFAPAAYAQKEPLTITGTIKSVQPVVSGSKSALLLHLEGRSETFVVRTADAPKFGLMKAETVSSGAEFGKMLEDLDKAKGWKVKLSAVAKEGKEWEVKSLERLPGQ